MVILPPSLPPILTVNQVPTTVEDVGDFTVTGTLTNDGAKDIKVVTDPSGILFTHFHPDVLDLELEGAGDSEEKITKPDFVGGVAKWSIETYLVEAKKQDTGLSERGSADSSDEDESGSQVSTSDSSKTSAGGSSQGEEKVYPRYTTKDLKAGGSIEFEYKVGQGYDFTESGAGAYSVKLARDFFWVLIDGVLSEAKVDVKPSTVEIKGKLSAAKARGVKVEEGNTTKRAASSLATINCDERPGESKELEKAVEWATKIKEASIESLKTMDSDGADRGPYEFWFGSWDTKAGKFRKAFTPKDHVRDLYSKVRSFYKAGNDDGYTYDCGCDLNIWAWVEKLKDKDPMPDHPIMNLCNWFRSSAVIGGYDTKAGTLIHEASHFPTVRPQTKDFAYGPEASHALRLRPFDEAMNADTYEYFSEDQYKGGSNPWAWDAGEP